MKRALVTGIAGQDGPYLARHLIAEGYEVYGTYRNEATRRFPGLEYLNVADDRRLKLITMDLIEYENVARVVREVEPDEVYNLAAQSHVGFSFKVPVSTLLSTGLGVTHLLEAVRTYVPGAKFYQASTSELFGGMTGRDGVFSETTPFHPRSPYAAAKAYAYYMVQNYREAYNLFTCNGILFNHESPLRGTNFVTRKVTKAATEIANAIECYAEWDPLQIGNIDASRDWGHAADYVRAMYLMMQHKDPDDYVIATGKNNTIRELVRYAFKCVDIEGVWSGEGLHAQFLDRNNGNLYVRVNPDFYRPSDCNDLKGNPEKAQKVLGWVPQYTFHGLIADMIEYDKDNV